MGSSAAPFPKILVGLSDSYASLRFLTDSVGISQVSGWALETHRILDKNLGTLETPESLSRIRKNIEDPFKSILWNLARFLTDSQDFRRAISFRSKDSS